MNAIPGLIERNKAGKLELLREVAAEIAKEAAIRFDASTLGVGGLICSTAVGNDKAYKIFKINESTVEIALPDMIMVTVDTTSLYDPSDAEDILWDRINRAME